MKNVNFDIFRGDSFRRSIRFKEDGVNMDITGSTVSFTVKNSLSDDDESLYTQDVSAHLEPLNGLTGFSITNEVMADLDINSYYYDIQLVTSDGYIKTVLTGRLNVLQDVTTKSS